MSLRVAVIGGGVVGLSAALALGADGHAVTLVEPGEAGGPHGASYGHGAWISPASVVPMSTRLWRRVPGFLLDPLGPLTIRPRALPVLLPWLVRFVLAGRSVVRVERTSRALAALLADAPDRHVALARSAGVADLMRRDGLLYAYPSRAAFEAEALSWRLRRDNGVGWEELDEAALRARVPALARSYRFGVLVPAGAHCVDPGAYLAALARRAVALGATLARTRATGFDLAPGPGGSRLRAVLTEAGPIACDRAVVAAGIGSAALARAAGDRVPLASERGYHVVVDASGDAMPALPVMPSDGRMANTPTLAGLRAAGQVELARPEDPPDWRRADILLRHLLATYPGLTGPGLTGPGLSRPAASDAVRRWMGHRPSTPDGLPAIGPARASPDIVHAFGHGHVGFATGPVTGAIVADLVAGRAPPLPIAPYRAGRF